MDFQNVVLASIPAKQVVLVDVLKIIEKKGSYRFLVIEKTYANDTAILDALSKLGVKTITIKD